MEMLLIGHDGHHSISLTNSPNGGLHARHLPLQRVLVRIFVGRRGVCTRSAGLNEFTTGSAPVCKRSAFSNASYFPHLGNEVMSWTHSCYSSAFRFSNESDRITAPLNSISKFRSSYRGSSITS